MKNVATNLNLDWSNNMNYQYTDTGTDEYFDGESLKKMLIIFGVGCLIGVILALIFAGFLYGIQEKTNDDGKINYGKLFIIVITPCILLGLIAGILLL